MVKKLSDYKYFLTAVFTITFLLSMITGIFYVSVSENPVRLKNHFNFKMFSFIPQGWAFFTRSPREAQIILYEMQKDGNITKYPQKHSSYKNLFGLDRKASKVIAEIQGLKLKLHDSLFINSKWRFQIVHGGEFPQKIEEIQNEIHDPILCGEYLLVFQKPVPWAWSRSIKTIEMPAKIIRLKILCDETKVN